MFFSYIDEVAQTPKFVMRKKIIDPTTDANPTLSAEIFFLNRYPIPAINKKLPYTNGIVAWNPRKISEMSIAMMGIMNPPVGTNAPEKSANEAMGDTFGA